MPSTVLVTFPSLNIAREISTELVEKRLAACSNLFECESIYRWKDSVETQKEAIALLKIRTEDFVAVKGFIQSRHPYEVPCIVRYEISEGPNSYISWIKESTERSPQD